VSVLGRIAVTGTPLALSLLIGCSQAPLDEEPEAHTKTQPVYGGIVSTEENDAVVHLTSGPDHARYCSGTVVAPRLVITARHCVAPYVEGSYRCDADGDFSSSLPRSPATAGAVGLAYDPELVEIRMGQFPFDKEPAFGEKIYTIPTDTICRNDIAIVRVDRDLPIAPRAMRLKDPTLPGELVTVVGYGKTFTDVPGRHERHDVEIQAVGKSTIYPEGKGAFDRTLRLGQAACPGDSGGPTLADSGAILGVFSIIENECNSDTARNYYTQLAPYRNFIEDAFEDSGFEVLYEPTPSNGAGGAAGASGDSGGGGGTDASGGSAGAGGTSSTIEGRRKKKDGCSVGAVGDAGALGGLAPLVLGLVALRRRSHAKPGPR